MKRKEEDFPQNRRNSSASCHALIGLIFQVAMMTRQNGSPYMGTLSTGLALLVIQIPTDLWTVTEKPLPTGDPDVAGRAESPPWISARYSPPSSFLSSRYCHFLSSTPAVSSTSCCFHFASIFTTFAWFMVPFHRCCRLVECTVSASVCYAFSSRGFDSEECHHLHQRCFSPVCGFHGHPQRKDSSCR